LNPRPSPLYGRPKHAGQWPDQRERCDIEYL
jgi:hypothetical protein